MLCVVLFLAKCSVSVLDEKVIQLGFPSKLPLCYLAIETRGHGAALFGETRTCSFLSSS